MIKLWYDPQFELPWRNISRFHPDLNLFLSLKYNDDAIVRISLDQKYNHEAKEEDLESCKDIFP